MILGSILPHVGWLFGGLTRVFNAQALIEIQAIRTLGDVLKYRSVRILFIIGASIWLGLWTIEQSRELFDDWHRHQHHAVGFGTAFGLSGGLGRLFRTF